MYIKLIQPKMNKRPMDTDIKIRMSPPLGLYAIVNLLGTNHKVTVENENIQRIVYDDEPDIVGITVTVDTFQRAVCISKQFREKGIVVVAGGVHITTAYQTVPKSCFDVLCIGMAEGTWNHIVSDYESGCLQSFYRCMEQERMTAVSPAYKAILAADYLYTNIIYTSLGCPFRCDFCYNSSENRTYVNRSVENVLEDIAAVNSRHVMFIDDNFIGNPGWTNQFLDAIQPLKLKWNAAVSVNIVKHLDLLDKMKQCGCQSLFIGFESINRNSIESVHKVQNERNIYETAVKEIHSRGIMINASFVFGLDGDTKDTFVNTRDWIVKHKIETATLHILTPYPGTKLYERLVSEDRILSEDFTLYNTAHVVFQTKNMTAEELYSGYRWLYQNIYSFNNIMRRIPESRNQVLPYLTYNFFYRKFGRFTDILCKCLSYRLIGALGQKLSKYI